MITSKPLRKWTALGTGAGAEIDGDAIHVAVVRVRPSGHTVLGMEIFAGFRERPATEWGAEIADFLKRMGAADRPLMIVLPPSESLSKTLSLPGVSNKDLPSAIEFQIEGLQPFGEGSAATAWSPLEGTSSALLGFSRTETIEHYATLFAEAGLPLAGFTTPPAAIRAAMLFREERPAEFLAMRHSDTEVRLYGESPSAPVFWAAMDMAPERATALARSQMRLSSEAPNEDLDALLPGASLAGAAALMSACPWLTPNLNLLPERLRTVQSRWMFVPTAVLAGLLALSGLALANLNKYEDGKLIGGLNQQTTRFAAEAQRAAQADKDRHATQARIDLLKDFRARNRKDLDSLIEATRLVAPPAWVRRLDLTRTSIALSGEAGNAADLPKILDTSPLFRNSEFLSPLSRSSDSPMDVFNVRAHREEKK